MLIWRSVQYMRYLRNAKNRHGTHSPFVYALLDNVVYDRRPRPEYETVERQKAQLLQDRSTITITDLGAGSAIRPMRERTIADIARNSAKPPRYGRLLHRLIAHFQPQTMLELGTSLGISAMYQALGNPTGHLTTFEGCPQTAAVAKHNLASAGVNNATIIEGNFDDTLLPWLNSIDRLDYAFIDGNHRKDPTLRYFEACLSRSHENTLMVFDDINWSKEMAEAWQNIQAHPQVTVTLDFFQLGIVFFRKGQAKQHFAIRY